MKVMLILASSGPSIGGMERQAADQAEALSKIPETEICIIADNCFESLFANKVIHHPVRMNRSRRNICLLVDTLKAIRCFSPDIIHAHGHKAAALLSSLKAFINKDIKLIASAHGLKRSSKPLKRMHQIFAVSQGVADTVKPLPSQVVLNGIKPHPPSTLSKSAFCQELNLDPSLPIVLGVGRLVLTKRFDRLVKASAGLQANVIICGDGPELNKLKALAPPNCLLIGHRSDIRDILFVADLMVITTDRDGFSLALIEALHSGLPVLSTAVPGAEDLLPETCLIRDTEPHAIHHFIKAHLNNLDSLKHLQHTLFEFARNKLLISQVADHTHSLYRKILTNSKAT